MISALLLLTGLGDPPNRLVVRNKQTIGETCDVTADGESGPFRAVVTWAPCEEVEIRTTSETELRSIGEFLELSPEDQKAVARQNKGQLISAWGEFAATIYIQDGAGAREIAIVD